MRIDQVEAVFNRAKSGVALTPEETMMLCRDWIAYHSVMLKIASNRYVDEANTLEEFIELKIAVANKTIQALSKAHKNEAVS